MDHESNEALALSLRRMRGKGAYEAYRIKLTQNIELAQHYEERLDEAIRFAAES